MAGWPAPHIDRKVRVLTIVDRAKSCTCPLVKQGLTPAAQCECTLGWQEETYLADPRAAREGLAYRIDTPGWQPVRLSDRSVVVSELARGGTWTRAEATVLTPVAPAADACRSPGRIARAHSSVPCGHHPTCAHATRVLAHSSGIFPGPSHFGCTWGSGSRQSDRGNRGPREITRNRRGTRGSKGVPEDGMRARRVRMRVESCSTRPRRWRPARRRCRTSAWHSPATRWPRWSASWPPGPTAPACAEDPREDRPGMRQAGRPLRQVQGRPRRVFRHGQEGLGHRLPWDKEKGIITVAVAEGECGCPLVDNKRTPPFFCNCSVGIPEGIVRDRLRTAGPGVAQGVEARRQQAVRLRGLRACR